MSEEYGNWGRGIIRVMCYFMVLSSVGIRISSEMMSK